MSHELLVAYLEKAERTIRPSTVDGGLGGMLLIEALPKIARSERKWKRMPAR